jgi:hypothetical protein
MNFMDILIEALWKELDDPAKIRECLYLLIMDLASNCEKLSTRKSWEMIAALVAFVSKEEKFPSEDEISGFKAEINSQHRGSEIRTSNFLTSLKLYELGEAELREFLSMDAWRGLPGFSEENRDMAREHKGRKTFLV